ncbi:MAG: hypothetical protein SOH60_10245 [Lachnospiraceae bacterium]|jgi:predicted HAD superfamily phosphohydrolase
MLLTEYDPEKEKELLAKMAYKEGQMSMRIRNLTTLMRVESLSLEQAMDKLEVPEEERETIREAFQKKQQGEGRESADQAADWAWS